MESGKHRSFYSKPTHEVTSYQPNSLLPLISNVLEKLLLKRLKPILIGSDVIPDHQFGFRQWHFTLQQIRTGL